MGTTLIESRKNGFDPNKLSDQQRMFVLELLASDNFCVTKAARKAGYKHPAQAANKLLKNKHIRAALGKAQREREERCQLKADDVLNYLRSALFFNPLHYFRPYGDGKWLIDNPDDLPEEVGRLIDGMEVKVVERDGETRSYFKVTLVSKATALGLAMKHIGVEKHEVTHSVDWDVLYDEDVPDLIEAEIAEALSSSED